ncbi:ETEC_3214 domain-containing protein [Thalassotalea sp. PLHSN55]|uniref:ETEC_3214 domain-containing protein n=1 Tax=Thalassotalea sp. PLHSN55 TaxID=3435888 RepID=UPI003F87A301
MVNKSKFYEKFVALALGLMAVGQWADTKEMATEAYVAFVSHFTHSYEYELLNKVNIGSNVDYIKQYFGEPQLIKKSKYVNEVSFLYYLNDKYILSLVTKNSRVSAYTIQGLLDDFSPDDLLNKKPIKGNKTIVQHTSDFVKYSFDYNNVEFFLVLQEQGKDKLFIHKYFGAVNYGNNSSLAREQLHDLYNEVDVQDDDPKQIGKARSIARDARNNFYGAGEEDLSLIAESILTKFEYSLYYKK